MLLRRVTQHFEDQNWFAVTLDLFVVVLGIFIGLQVDAWNTTRQERVLEREYLERLLADIELSIERQLAVAEEDHMGQANVDKIAQAVRDESLEALDRQIIDGGFNFTGWLYEPPTILITIRELQATGNISLIQDVQIREALGQLEASFALARFSAEQTSNLLVEGQQRLMTWVYMPRDNESAWGYSIEPDYDRITADPAAANVLSWFSAWSKFHTTLLDAHHEDTVALRDLLSASLGG